MSEQVLSELGSASTKPPLARKLEHLFTHVHPPGRGEYTHQEVSDGIRNLGGGTISASYLWQLRKGEKDNPTMRHLEALAAFFGVPPSFFFDSHSEEETLRIQSEVELAAALRDAGVRRIALRAVGLPAKGLDSIEQLIDMVRDVHGLNRPDATPPEQPGGSRRTADRRGKDAATDPVGPATR